jgi:hypothetical protein
MKPSKKSTPSANKSISINGDVKDSAVFIGDNNTVNQTVIQKFFNIFKSDSETLEHRNRRILLGHVDNAWIKGVLDASLHGAALLDLGIKQDPEAVTKYPWAIKKESTDETLPTGTSMLEIFDSIGMGRSLLILGAPGSGKTTMLLELARQLIARAREDVTYPIPMVFNLASWTEKLTLTDWLAQELNNLYSVPKKIAPDWIKGSKLLLLMDGLDEVPQKSRTQCVEAINAFRKQNGLTSLAVCSRSQDYADLNTKLSFEGAIDVQPLTQEQIHEFFSSFGEEMAGIKQVIQKDNALRGMAETPLFLSIMIMAYRDKQVDEIPVFAHTNIQRKYLFDHYIERMFDRYKRLSHKFELGYNKTAPFNQENIKHWIPWLASKMIGHNAVPYFFENMQPDWLDAKKKFLQSFMVILIFGLVGGLIKGLIGELIFGLLGLIYVLTSKISTVDSLSWNWGKVIKRLSSSLSSALKPTLIFVLIIGLIIGLSSGLIVVSFVRLIYGLIGALFLLLFLVLVNELTDGLFDLLSVVQVQTTHPGQKLVLTAKNFLFVFLFFSLITWVVVGLSVGLTRGSLVGLIFGLFVGLIIGLTVGLIYGGLALIRHYILRFVLAQYNLLPWRLVPFLDHCVDLIFLRRVGGGYIFVHRLLMEHFAEMYVETPTPKGN